MVISALILRRVMLAACVCFFLPTLLLSDDTLISVAKLTNSAPLDGSPAVIVSELVEGASETATRIYLSPSERLSLDPGRTYPRKLSLVSPVQMRDTPEQIARFLGPSYPSTFPPHLAALLTEVGQELRKRQIMVSANANATATCTRTCSSYRA